MYTRELNVLTDRIHHDLAMISHGIHLHLFGMFDELADHHRMLLADIRRQLQETLQLLLIGANIHRRATQHIAGTNQDREAHLRYEAIDILHRGKLLPAGLIHPDTIQHGRELLTILRIVNALSGRTQDVDMLLIQAHRQVVGDLASCGDNHTMRILQFQDIHHPLKGQLIEIESITHIIIRGDSLWVIVDHHRAVALLTDGIQRLHTAPVELHRATDTIRTRTQHHDRTVIARIGHIMLGAAVGQIEVVGLCRILRRQGVDLLHHRQDAMLFAELTHQHRATLRIPVQTNRTGNLEVRETLNLRRTNQLRIDAPTLNPLHIKRMQLLRGLHDVIQLLQEPTVNLGQLIDLIHRITGTEGL